MRSGFETYRAFRQDTSDTRAILDDKGKLTLPVLLVAGQESLFTKVGSTPLNCLAGSSSKLVQS